MAQTQQPKNLEEALKVTQQLTKMIEHQNQLIEQMNVALQLQQHRRFSKKMKRWMALCLIFCAIFQDVSIWCAYESEATSTRRLVLRSFEVALTSTISFWAIKKTSYMSFLKYRRSVRCLEYVLLWCAYELISFWYIYFDRSFNSWRDNYEHHSLVVW